MTEHTLQTQNLSVGYDETTIIEDLNLEIPAHKVSVIIGANGCGKSTLMKTLSRLLKPEKGQVVLDGKAVHGYPSTQLAQMLGLLPQSPTVPEGITVADLVARGRYPYRKFMQNMTKEDYAAVEDALERMGITELANRCVDELSGGQRQRAAGTDRPQHQPAAGKADGCPQALPEPRRTGKDPAALRGRTPGAAMRRTGTGGRGRDRRGGLTDRGPHRLPGGRPVQGGCSGSGLSGKAGGGVKTPPPGL